MRTNLDLKRSYLAAGAACKPAIALTSVSNAIRSWTNNIETALRQDVPKEDIIKALEELRLSADFVRVAAIDTIRCSARSMLHSVMVKRVFWLEDWLADLFSNKIGAKSHSVEKHYSETKRLKLSPGCQEGSPVCFPRTEGCEDSEAGPLDSARQIQ